MMSGIDSRHCKISTGLHLQNGHHNTAQIQHCQESIWDIIIYLHMKFRWNRTMLNLCGIVAAIVKMATGRNFYVGNQFGTSLSTHISNFDDIGQCWIFAVLWWPFWKWQPVEIFTSGINSGQHYLPTYQILMISDNVEFLCRVLAPQYRKNSTLSDIIKIWYVGR
jgi:hypothetical protein